MKHRTAGLVGSCALVGGALLSPATATAEEIRVLFIASGGPELRLQVRGLEQAIEARSGPLAVARELTDADVIIQFTRYRRTVGANGEPARAWHGEARLLVPAEPAMAAEPSLAGPRLDRFSILMMTAEDKPEMPQAVDALARMLRKALGREPRRERRPDDVI
jgi:hypothetical protein